MATLDFRTALEQAKQDPNSALAISLRQSIESGEADIPAMKQGVDLTPYGRPSIEEIQKQESMKLGVVEETREDIAQIGEGIGEAKERRLDKLEEIEEARERGEQGAISTGFQKFGQGIGFLSDVAGEVIVGTGKIFLPEDVEQAIGERFESGVEKVASTDIVQSAIEGFSELEKTNPELARNLEAVMNTGLAALDVAGVKGGSKAITLARRKAAETGEVVKKVAKPVAEKAELVKEAVVDIKPTLEGAAEFNAVRALELTQGDIKKISKSTGNQVGKFLADQNLIGKNTDATLDNLNAFYKKNYDDVRSEIAKVDRIYDINDLPSTRKSLEALRKQVSDVPGLEQVDAEVAALLGKKEFTLSEIQRVKELLDEQFDLYNVVGDVGASTQKKGLANIRGEMREFIENEVRDVTGADIKKLNNNVSTSKSIEMAVLDRIGRGMTRSKFSLGDIAVFSAMTGFVGPAAGTAAFAVKKIAESAPVRLRLAQWFDSISDAKKAKVAKDMEKGIVPDKVKEIIDEVEKSFGKIAVPVGIEATREGLED